MVMQVERRHLNTRKAIEKIYILRIFEAFLIQKSLSYRVKDGLSELKTGLCQNCS